MCTPQVALRAMPLTAGQDFWLYRGLLSRLQLMACGARLAAAADGDANDRQARPLPSRRERGTGAIVHISRVKIVAMTRFRAVRTSLTSVSLDGMVRRVVAQRHEITISVPIPRFMLAWHEEGPSSLIMP